MLAVLSVQPEHTTRTSDSAGNPCSQSMLLSSRAMFCSSLYAQTPTVILQAKKLSPPVEAKVPHVIKRFQITQTCNKSITQSL
jgi:hypothetical protein